MTRYEYQRGPDTARQLVAEADPRVAVVLGLMGVDPEAKARELAKFDDRDRAFIRAREVAAMLVVELCRLGYRIGWDSATAAAHEIVARANANGRGIAEAVSIMAVELLDDGLGDPWPEARR